MYEVKPYQFRETPTKGVKVLSPKEIVELQNNPKFVEAMETYEKEILHGQPTMARMIARKQCTHDREANGMAAEQDFVNKKIMDKKAGKLDISEEQAKLESKIQGLNRGTVMEPLKPKIYSFPNKFKTREEKIFKTKLDNIPPEDFQFIDTVFETLVSNGFKIDKDELMVMLVESNNRELFKARLERMAEDVVDGTYIENIKKDKDYYINAGSDRLEVKELTK